jgi:prepilin-type N-terminal cleavage/methylation domain-containing protein
MKRYFPSLELEKGFSLIELLITISIISVLVAIATMGSGFISQNRLPAASRQLYSDLQKLRQDALTKCSLTANNSLGFGIRLSSNNSYVVFEFDDYQGGTANFTYDGTGEELAAASKSLPSSVSMTVNPTANNVLLYDKKGIVRTGNWTAAGVTNYVLTSSSSSQSRCVSVGATSIREGIWNGSACITQ